MKKRLLLLTILALILSACFVLSSCDKPNTDEGKEPSSSSSQKEENNTDNSQNDDQKDDDNQDKEPTAEYVTVTFDTNGGSTIDSVQIQMGEKVTQPQDLQREGYTFDGWYLGDEKWSFIGYVVTENMTLTAKWTPITYTITYVGNVNHSNKTTYTIEDESFDLTGIGKTYYEFLGWYTDNTFTELQQTPQKGDECPYAFYAKWEIINYSIKLDADGGIVNEVEVYEFKKLMPTVPVIYEDENILLADKPQGLLSHPDKIFTKIQLMDEIWGAESNTGWETVTVHIGRLRKRFEDWTEFEIESVRGLGYKAVYLK